MEPPLNPGRFRWKHIIDRHLHQWSDTPNNLGSPDQFLEAIDIEEYPFDWNLSDEENTKKNVILMIYAAICFGDAVTNTGPTPGVLYTVGFPTEVGFKPSTGVETRFMQVLVRDSDLSVHTAFPLNPSHPLHADNQ